MQNVSIIIDKDSDGMSVKEFLLSHGYSITLIKKIKNGGILRGRTPVTGRAVLLEGDEDCVLRFMRRAQNAEKCALLCYHEELDMLRCERLIDIGAKDDLATQASRLFSALRDADKLDCDVIYAHLPAKDGLGLALYNRLIRAAAHTVIHVNHKNLIHHNN